MMHFNFDKELSLYKFTRAMKKADKAFHEGGVLFNQQVLIACGEIHAKMMTASKDWQADNKDFFEGFAWTYYMDWRKARAKSCAHLLDMYRTLNVKLGVQHFIGETFYAGIPTVTAEEIEQAIKLYQVGSPITEHDDGFSHEKVGIDGQLHKTNKDGEFLPGSPDDIYGDGSMVSAAELHADVEPAAELACLSCIHQDGDGTACVDCGELT